MGLDYSKTREPSNRRVREKTRACLRPKAVLRNAGLAEVGIPRIPAATDPATCNAATRASPPLQRPVRIGKIGYVRQRSKGGKVRRMSESFPTHFGLDATFTNVDVNVKSNTARTHGINT
jgi:hypothetical protein